MGQKSQLRLHNRWRHTAFTRAFTTIFGRNAIFQLCPTSHEFLCLDTSSKKFSAAAIVWSSPCISIDSWNLFLCSYWIPYQYYDSKLHAQMESIHVRFHLVEQEKLLCRWSNPKSSALQKLETFNRSRLQHQQDLLLPERNHWKVEVARVTSPMLLRPLSG